MSSSGYADACIRNRNRWQNSKREAHRPRKSSPGARTMFTWFSTPPRGRTGLCRRANSLPPLAVTGIILRSLIDTAKGASVVAISRELGLPIRFGRKPASRSTTWFPSTPKPTQILFRLNRWEHTTIRLRQHERRWPAKASASLARIEWWLRDRATKDRLSAKVFIRHNYEWRDHAEIVAMKTAGENARGATFTSRSEQCNPKPAAPGPARRQSRSGRHSVVAAPEV